MARQAKSLAVRVIEFSSDDTARIQAAYSTVYGRPPNEREIEFGLKYLAARSNGASVDAAWEEYAQALLSTNEFAFMD
jgi:hypothetical protein